jgi:y4mF family transcriptional regulator
MNVSPESPATWMLKMGVEIRRHRKQAGLTQLELARLAGVGKTVVFDLEKGKATSQVATLLSILSVLNIQLTWQAPPQEVGDA